MLVEQVHIFGWSMLVGAILGIIFDIFRGLRWEGIRDIWVYLQDIVFWIVTALIIIVSSFLLNQGELRGYMIIGYLLGAGFYVLLLSKYVLGVFKWVTQTIRNLFHKFIIMMKKIHFTKKQKTLEVKQEI